MWMAQTCGADACGITVVPFWRSYKSSIVDHFYTTNATEVSEFIAAGYGLELTAAWVYTEGICGSHPLFRLFDPKKGDHFYTTSKSEVQAFLAQYSRAEMGKGRLSHLE
ncbi:hypothetical protein B0H13DRAFT_2315673 [Mycena leptocephala]|nr:hypothetical protein B0H13DRAFT_2315673 [Mycena leptocephala]